MVFNRKKYNRTKVYVCMAEKTVKPGQV